MNQRIFLLPGMGVDMDTALQSLIALIYAAELLRLNGATAN
jgi:hypothetical protein